MFFSDDNLTLELTGIFHIERSNGCRRKSVQRQYDSLSIRLSGGGIFEFDSETKYISENELLYLPSDSVYSHKTDGEVIIAIHFINYGFSKRRKFEVAQFESNDAVKEIVLKMYRLWSLKEAGYKHECTSMLYHLLYIIRKQSAEKAIKNAAPDSYIYYAVNYIHKHYKTERIYVSQLAKMISISEVYFRKIFKKIYKVSPNKYINNLRLEYASQLLQSGFYRIYEVSELSGFTDVKYFTKCFKEKYGISPLEYKTTNPEKHMS